MFAICCQSLNQSQTPKRVRFEWAYSGSFARLSLKLCVFKPTSREKKDEIVSYHGASYYIWERTPRIRGFKVRVNDQHKK